MYCVNCDNVMCHENLCICIVHMHHFLSVVCPFGPDDQNQTRKQVISRKVLDSETPRPLVAKLEIVR